ncbi:hypothetical protein MJO28_013467 [Puccinia striiformis f. sp. tritici]|uniref:Uncharacterized protein n=1 Tax=Puccinia striiformis f. sp. tritici TaxID=168172 RepID=A0ACC0E092_9BASI|nr:hypothetical protein MJO28_013467 [Puccinia striiformis f. sp. tritici]
MATLCEINTDEVTVNTSSAWSWSMLESSNKIFGASNLETGYESSLRSRVWRERYGSGGTGFANIK